MSGFTRPEAHGPVQISSAKSARPTQKILHFIAMLAEIKYGLSLAHVVTSTAISTTLGWIHQSLFKDTPTENPLSYKLATALFREMLDVEKRTHTLRRVRTLFNLTDALLDKLLSPSLLRFVGLDFQLRRGTITFDLKLIEAWEKAVLPVDGYVMPVEVQDGIDGLLQTRIPKNSYTINLEFIRTQAQVTRTNKLILFAHGGGFCFLTPTTCRHLAILLSKATGCDVLGVDYRKAGENPFPAAIHDMLSAYIFATQPTSQLILNSTIALEKYDPKDVFLFGDSAGGGIALSLLAYMDKFLPFRIAPPRAIILSSPFIDLTCTHPSWKKHSRVCALPEIIGPDGQLNKKIYLRNGIGGSPNPVWGYVNGWSDDIYSRVFFKNDDDDDTLEEGREEVELRKRWMERMVLHPCVSPSRSLMPSALEGPGYKTRMLVQSGAQEVLLDEAHELISRLAAYSKHEADSKTEHDADSKTVKQIVHQTFQDMHHDFVLFGDGWLVGPKQITLAFDRINTFIQECQDSESQGIERVFVSTDGSHASFY